MATDERTIAAACAALRRIALSDKSEYDWTLLNGLSTDQLATVTVIAGGLLDLAQQMYDHEYPEPDLSDCPYYQYFRTRGEPGVCQSGCWEEPRCITEEPADGWPSVRMAVEQSEAVA